MRLNCFKRKPFQPAARPAIVDPSSSPSPSSSSSLSSRPSSRVSRNRPGVTTAAPPRTMTNLPSDVLRHIAAGLDDERDVLSFALSAFPCLRAARELLDGTLHISSSLPDPELWSLILSPSLKHLTHTVVYTATPAQKRALMHVLGHAKLLTMSLPAFNPLIDTQRFLRDLSIRLDTTEQYLHLSYMLPGMPYLTALTLHFGRDFGMVHLPVGCRCSCDRFRANPHELVEAVPQLAKLDVRCDCLLARRMTVPRFKRLRGLSFAGRLLGFEPSTDLIRTVPMLTSLEFRHIDKMTAMKLSSAEDNNLVGNAVTSIETVPESKFTAAELERLSLNCPNLEKLSIALHYDAEVALTKLTQNCPRLRELRLSFDSRKVSYDDGVIFHKLTLGLLGKLPPLTALEITSTGLDKDDLFEFLKISGAHLEKVVLPVHAQMQENPFHRATSVLELVTEHCSRSQLKVLEFQTIAVKELAITKYISEMKDDEKALFRLRRAFHMFRRLFPFVKFQSVYKVVCMLDEDISTSE